MNQDGFGPNTMPLLEAQAPYAATSLLEAGYEVGSQGPLRWMICEAAFTSPQSA